jgi:hypothetical protein
MKKMTKDFSSPRTFALTPSKRRMKASISRNSLINQPSRIKMRMKSSTSVGPKWTFSRKEPEKF